MNPETYANILSGMVRIPTISNEDHNKMDFTRFDEFHRYLEEHFPLIHRTMTKTVIDRANLLFHWKGANPTKLPLLYMGHQDVVPPGDPAGWTDDPFSGAIHDGCVWGRGSNDCKSVICAEMCAVEELIGEGFVPDQDLYLAFCQNEEVMCPDKGAPTVVRYLADQGVRLGAVFDEGGRLDPTEDGRLLARVNLGEKATQNYRLFVESAGGHSQAPGKGTALGSLARGIAALEAHPFEPRLTPLAVEQLKAQAPFAAEERRAAYADPENHLDELIGYAEDEPYLDALIRTTMAVTMAGGSAQANILPDLAWAVMNARLLPGDTHETILAHLREILPEDVQAEYRAGEDPTPASVINGPAYRLLIDVLDGLYPGLVTMMPGLMTGGTDSMYYQEICDEVFRFTGMIEDDRSGGVHGFNEHFLIETLATGVTFYKTFARAYQK